MSGYGACVVRTLDDGSLAVVQADDLIEVSEYLVVLAACGWAPGLAMSEVGVLEINGTVRYRLERHPDSTTGNVVGRKVMGPA